MSWNLLSFKANLPDGLRARRTRIFRTQDEVLFQDESQASGRSDADRQQIKEGRRIFEAEMLQMSDVHYPLVPTSVPGPERRPTPAVTSWAFVRHSVQVKLVFLYGPPGVGKYTIGVELAARTGFRLFHNHLTVNLVSAVFERDSDVWLRMLRSVRRDVLAEAARNRVDLVMTSVFNGTAENAEAWRTMLEPFAAEGGSVLFVQLTCEREELFRRVEQESRRALDKLVDSVRLRQLLDRFDMFSSAPFGEHLRLDVTHLGPSNAATAIIQHYGIGLL